jgi:predicted choloylglycine hydrolase
VTLLNCAYELSHIRPPKPFGCSAGITNIEGLGMVHVRTLDWPIAGMGAATRIFRLQRDDHKAIVVGFPGMVGALSGMVPGAYSATINWAPPGSWLPTFEFGPTFLLRDVLENCRTFESAVTRLRETQLATSVFFTICGAEVGQGCVIERTPKDSVVRPYLGQPLVQTNHHIDNRFEANNDDIREGASDDDVFSLDGSQKRHCLLSEQLAAFKGPILVDSLMEPLNKPTVLNGDTCQKMVFVPKRGDIRVLRKIGD